MSASVPLKIERVQSFVAVKSGGECFFCGKEILKFEKVVGVKCVCEEYKNPTVYFHKNCFKRHIKRLKEQETQK